MLTLRRMRIADLELVRAWLADRDVAEWYLFQLLGERSVPSEPTQAPMAIYRLKPETSAIAGRTDVGLRRRGHRGPPWAYHSSGVS
jgi:hypothetical protein